MSHTNQLYIGGSWRPATGGHTVPLVDPATERTVAEVAVAGPADVDASVLAAREAAESFAGTTVAERTELLGSIRSAYKTRIDALGDAMRAEMGAPVGLARRDQALAGLGHIGATRSALGELAVEIEQGTTTITYVPVGVAALITPWNWPMNQVLAKVAPALAAGCTVVLKPSELAPLSAVVLVEILEEAGVPAGVVNLLQGDGATTGAALSAHPGVDIVSFTGSTRAGIEISRAAAPTVKRVALELGGKSPNIVLDDADLSEVVPRDTRSTFANSGQSCAAPTRMLVPRARLDEAAELAASVATSIVVGDPADETTEIGPVVSARQFDRIQELIRSGVDEGATLVAGGPGRPDGLDVGYYVRPTVFADVDNSMRIAREEIFGPVLVIIGYDSEDDAVAIANDTPYGLAAYVSGTPERARRVARRLRAGTVHVNGAPPDITAPFGGFKQSGNGREWGAAGILEFLEVRSILGDRS